MTPRIYLDLDGVMADFDAHFPALFGVSQKEFSDAQMWEMINNHPSYFLDMPLCAGALGFMHFLDDINVQPIILTACPKSNYEHVAVQKKQWVANHLGRNLTVLPVMGGKNKYLFMHALGDILIDDMERNCAYWGKANGIAILHRDFNTTTDSLFELLAASKYRRDYLTRAKHHVTKSVAERAIPTKSGWIFTHNSGSSGIYDSWDDAFRESCKYGRESTIRQVWLYTDCTPNRLG